MCCGFTGVERKRNLAAPEPRARPALQNLCQFSRKSAAGSLLAISAATFPALRTLLLQRATGLRSYGWLRRRLPARSFFAFRRLRRVGSQEAILQGRSIETAYNGGHFVGGRRFDKCEALRFLRFVIANDFYGVSHQIFGGQPLFDVIGGDPGGEVAKKNGKAHSVIIRLRVGFAALQGGTRSAFSIVPEWPRRCKLVCSVFKQLFGTTIGLDPFDDSTR